MNIVVYPNLRTAMNDNSYIQNFINSLANNGVITINSPTKNPLLDINKKELRSSDVYIFHWLENVPFYKYGILQFSFAIYLLLKLKIKKKTIICFLHNKHPHSNKNLYLSLVLMRLYISLSNKIITHSEDGFNLIKVKYPQSANKVKVLYHPTKDRIENVNFNNTTKYDLLIWGSIYEYKGIYEFLKYSDESKSSNKYKIRIIGKCSSLSYWEKISRFENENIKIENREISFAELREYISISKFVLIPYLSASVLSSAILMDSLSFGAKVIGPNTGSFKDYAKRKDINVYTFNHYSEIFNTIASDKSNINIQSYKCFLEEYSWNNFAKRFISLI